MPLKKVPVRVAKYEVVLRENPLRATQAMHTVDASPPVVSEYVPAPHAMQLDSEADPTVVEYFPAAQSMHTVDALLPIVPEYFPAAQSMQVFWPLDG